MAQRVVVLGRSVNRLLTDPVGDLASFSVAPASAPTMVVTFTRHGATVQASVSSPVSAALRSSTDSEVRWLLGSPMLANAGDIERAVAATEISLANAARLPMDYTPKYTFTPTSEFYRNVTNFNVGNPVAQSSIALTPTVVVKALPYYAGNNPPTNPGQPTTNDLSTISISNDDLTRASVIKTTFTASESTNKDILEMVSRQTYHELTTQGSALVRFSLYDGTLSEPVRLYIVGTGEQDITVNGKTVKLAILNINGDFEKNHSPKPADAASGPDLIDPSDITAGAYNKFPSSRTPTTRSPHSSSSVATTRRMCRDR